MASLARSILLTPARWAHRLVFLGAVPRVAYVLGSFRSPQQIVYRWPEAGPIPVGPRPCVFVHWDGAGEVRPHVLDYVRALAQAGLSVLFVSNAGFLRPEALAAVQAVCAGVLIRRNVGYDFGAWREGFEQLGLPRADTEFAVMANDSVYGPLRPVSEMLQRLDFVQADAWGCTETWQSRYHLQSYFLAFAPGVLASPAWRRFWSEVRPTPSKHWVIQRYEIGLSQVLIRAGFSVRALWPYARLIEDIEPALLMDGRPDGPYSADPLDDVRKAHARRVRDAAVYRVPLNPTSDLWRQLLRAGFPFIKRELLRANPSEVLDIVDWRDVARATTAADFALIERDLQRVLRDRAA